ncbi:MAG: FecR domain-containing protein, partial [Leptospira sp.]|nr:FecR domain-containing protein [Leptospira sp.]
NVKINYGKVVTLLKKERKDESFNVLTPTTIAGVRGTSFLTSVEDLNDAESNKKVSCEGSSCRVTFAVIEGKIALTRPGSKEEIILEKNSQITIDREKKFSNKMVKPLNKESLKELKNMIVFHKNDVLGFSKLVDELKLGSEELREFESSGSLEDLKLKMSKRESSSNMADEVAKTASKVDESKYVKKDVGKENLKLQANKSYE